VNNMTLWFLDNCIYPRDFERMCTQLLYREGYEKIHPIGDNYDNGRDAEQIIQDINSGKTEITFFQYSLEKNWEAKLKKELKNIKKHDQYIKNYVFVTSQKVTGYKRDYYRKILEEQDIYITFFDREWLRFNLEEKNLDITEKYIGLKQDSPLLLCEVNDVEDEGISNEKKKIMSEIFMVETYFDRRSELFRSPEQITNEKLKNIRVKVNELLA
jgi:hypothetical protein